MQKRYNPGPVEKKWQKVWRSKKTHEPNLKNPKKPFYNLMMFPYPSAEGLHAGNMYAFTGADIYGRFKRMQGHDVFEPIGLDGFGIHSENYAIKIGAHPMTQAKVAEKRFYKQMESIGNGFSWSAHLETYDPEYYKWTQWVFLQMWKRGLAYRKKQAVNWCPSCKTVLADEQVISGECERCGSSVIKKELEQWFFRITKYADRLLNNLDKLDWSEKVKIAQKNWIGKSEGAEISWKVCDEFGGESGKTLVTFTTRKDTIPGVTFIVLAPESDYVREVTSGAQADAVSAYIKEASKRENRGEDSKTGVFTGAYAKNPFNGVLVPIYVADYVLGGYGTGAVMGMPGHDERDRAFAAVFGLPTILTTELPEGMGEEVVYTGEGVQINTGLGYDGLPQRDAAQKIFERLMRDKQAQPSTQYRLRDWLISRQRYWGPPIPMIHCEACAQAGKGEHKDMPGWYAEAEKNLPVKLPMVKEFRPTGKDESPLAAVKSFYQVKCPACKGRARRETDVSDTFLDSAWYFFRYIDVNNKKQAFDLKRAKQWLPIDMYIGGAEHSVLHLLYTRFTTMVFKDMKLINFEEPFKKFRAHGLIIKDGAKMSKSKGNVINPDEYIKKYGADVLRTYLMFLAPFEAGGDFQDTGMYGIVRFFDRVQRFYASAITKQKPSKEFLQALHQGIAKVTKDIEELHYNTAISALMVLLNAAEKEGSMDADSAKVFLKLLNPFAPHLCQELWARCKMKTILDREAWPTANAKLAQASTFELVVQINSKIRARITAPQNISQEDAEALVMALPEIQKRTAGKEIHKKIFVPNRLLNVIISE